jgi:hypothetical protein
VSLPASAREDAVAAIATELAVGEGLLCAAAS